MLITINNNQRLIKYIPILMLFFFLRCDGVEDISGAWKLEGEPVVFNFTEKQLNITEKDMLVIQAKKTSSKSSEIIYQVNQVGENHLIRKKYSINQFIHLSKPIIKKNEISVDIKTKNINKNYTLYQSKKEKTITSYSILHEVEKNEFLKDPAFIAGNKLYTINVSPTNNNDSQSVNLVDGDFSSSWQSQNLQFLFQHFFEFFFYHKNNNKLDNEIKLKALGFITSSSSVKQNKFKDHYLFHRIKKIDLQFTNKYDGGLGRSTAQYKDQKVQITLDDKPGLQIVYFYDVVFFNGVKMKIKEIYPGYNNKIKCSEIIFYLAN